MDETVETEEVITETTSDVPASDEVTKDTSEEVGADEEAI